MDTAFVDKMVFQEAERHHVVEYLVDLLSQRAAAKKLYKFAMREYKIPIIAAAPGLGKSRLLVELPRLLATALQQQTYYKTTVHPDIQGLAVESLAVTFNCTMNSQVFPPEQALAGRVAFVCKQIVGQDHVF